MERGAREATTAHGGGPVVDGAPTGCLRAAAGAGRRHRPGRRSRRPRSSAPCSSVHVVDTEDEAVALANATPYALAAGLWTDDLRRAHRVSRRLRAGTVSVNCVDALDVATPFGGFGQSGYGRDLSLHALDKFTGLKTTWFHHG